MRAGRHAWTDERGGQCSCTVGHCRAKRRRHGKTGFEYRVGGSGPWSAKRPACPTHPGGKLAPTWVQGPTGAPEFDFGPLRLSVVIITPGEIAPVVMINGRIVVRGEGRADPVEARRSAADLARRELIERSERIARALDALDRLDPVLVKPAPRPRRKAAPR